MTAEVGILNRMGIALAADSAVTIGLNYTQKVYNSANKLFALSKHHPVGIMIYGSANFMGVPWEIIIKSYRKQLGEEKFDTLKEYCDSFYNYVVNDEHLIEQYSATSQVKSVYHSYLTELLNKVNEEIHNSFSNPPSEEEVESIINFNLDFLLDTLNDFPLLEGFSSTFKDEFMAAHKEDLISVIDQTIFIPLEDETYLKLFELATEMFSKDMLSDLVSGIVISGYGEKEIFPAMFEFETEGIFCGRLKLIRRVHTKIGADGENTTASIRAFAQKEMVQMFMNGIDPRMESAISDALQESLINLYPQAIQDVTGIDFSAEQRESIEQLGVMFVRNYLQEIDRLQRENFVYPIVDTVDILPKEELAAMAEALVNLTSFKRKVTIDAETVGGPIDVAVITKGDGFVWIKRKHYFKPELNYQFFQKNIGGVVGNVNGDI